MRGMEKFEIALEHIYRRIGSRMICAVVLFIVLCGGVSCKREEAVKIEAVKDRQSLPGLTATKITTVVSDSGITRYRLYADKWEIFDRAQEPYWDFPAGLYFERFDENLAIDAHFQSQTARYYEYKRLWEFKGRVKAVNLEGEMFETDLLYWDEQQERIYSDKFIRVTQKARVITAVGFESDQSLTRYHFKNVQGIMAVDEDAEKTSTASAP